MSSIQQNNLNKALAASIQSADREEKKRKANTQLNAVLKASERNVGSSSAGPSSSSTYNNNMIVQSIIAEQQRQARVAQLKKREDQQLQKALKASRSNAGTSSSSSSSAGPSYNNIIAQSKNAEQKRLARVNQLEKREQEQLKKALNASIRNTGTSSSSSSSAGPSSSTSQLLNVNARRKKALVKSVQD